MSLAKKENPTLKIPQSQVLQQTLKQLEAAFVKMWEWGFGFPRFKKKMRFFVFPQIKPDLIQGNIINLPKLGKIKFRNSRSIPDGFIPKQVRIIKKKQVIILAFVVLAMLMFPMFLLMDTPLVLIWV